MWDGPFYRVRRDGYEICFVPSAGEPLEDVCNVDMWVIFADGLRWSGTIFTLAEVQRLMERWATTGEELGGSFFACWDGLIVRDAGIPAMVSVVDHLVQGDEYRTVFRCVGRADSAAD
ncbi:hypothetical protein ACFWA4_00155 [Streptomyces sp. NPDC060011]|uniref:hypothetical protein n=1 Tax=unclassified Streptomyces TaxID=2593676 RepID=UPI001941568F|nr:MULTISPECIES: hypothetical protein [unclassified Streptomyces]WSK62753.1 hypothetical protein OG458_24290 [Streptomyces sp. NBC_01281]